MTNRSSEALKVAGSATFSTAAFASWPKFALRSAAWRPSWTLPSCLRDAACGGDLTPGGQSWEQLQGRHSLRIRRGAKARLEKRALGTSRGKAGTAGATRVQADSVVKSQTV